MPLALAYLATYLPTNSTHIANPDVILIGSGIMSANLGPLLKCPDPKLSIQCYEITEELAQEAAHGWNNTGTPEGVSFARRPPVWLKAGDTIAIEIEGIGTLSNPVV